MVKKIIGWLLLVITTISLSIVVGINGNYIFHKKDWYTKKQVEEKVDEAYNEGLEVNKNGDILALATEYKLKYDESKAQAEALEKELESEKLKNSLLSENVESLTTTKESAEAEVERLNNIVRDNERTIASKVNEISNLEKDIEELEKVKANNETTIAIKQNRIAELEAEISRIESIESSKDSDIALLKNQISTLKNDISVLETENANKDNQIASLTSQISNLQNLNSQLQTTNELNLQTINSLNAQITSLNTQITDMTLQLQNNSSNVSSLNNRIADLEKSIAYYEQYIANLENDEKIAITFEFDNSVYNIQIINKNGICSVNDPTSTEYVIFNYWTVNGERIDLSTKTFSSNTKVIADVTYKYDVKFVVDETEYNSQIVTKNSYPTLPANPTKEGYEFDGWTKNGVDLIDPTTDSITQNTTYSAVFTKLHTVTFMYNDNVKETQTVRNNECATNFDIEEIADGNKKIVFNGWKLNDIIVDVSTQKIVSNTTFVADVTKYYCVDFIDRTKGFSVIKHTCYVEENHLITDIPKNPTNIGYEFDGWTYSGSMVDFNVFKVTKTTSLYAKFTKLHTVTFISDEETIETKTVRDGEKTTSVSIEGTDYKVFNGWKLNDTIVNVAETTITEDTTFVADWTYRYDVKFMIDEIEFNSQLVTENCYPILPENPTKDGYEFDGWTKNGVDLIDPTTDTITQNTTYTAKFTKLHTVTFVSEGTNIETRIVRDGEKTTSVSIEGTDHKVFNGWKLNNIIVNVAETTITEDTTFVADWTYRYDVKFMIDEIEFNSQLVTENCYPILPENPTKDGYEFDGWTKNGVDLIDPTTDTITQNTKYIAIFYNYNFVNIEWNGLTSFYGSSIWTDGIETYYSNSDKQYILNKETNTWETKTWTGLTSFDGKYIWTDGKEIYYSNDDKQYILNKENSEWVEKNWSGVIPYGYNVWTDGLNIYCSTGTSHSKLVKCYSY